MSQKSTDTEKSLITEYKSVCCQNPKYCSTRETCPNPGYKLDKKLTFYRALDKWDRIGPEGVRQLLGKGRMDTSGDFTPGCGYSDDQIECIMMLMKWGTEGSNEERLRKMKLWFYVMDMKFDK